MAKLHRLPSGDWIALSDVTGIYVHPPSVIGRKAILSNVAVKSGVTVRVVSFPDYDGAREFADKLAALVNDA